MSQPEPEGDY